MPNPFISLTDFALGGISVALGLVSRFTILLADLPAALNSPLAQTIVAGLIGGCFFLLGKVVEPYVRFRLEERKERRRANRHG